MNKNVLFLAFNDVDDDILERSEVDTCGSEKRIGWLKWGAMAACFGLIFTLTMMTLPNILKEPSGILPPPNSDLGVAVGGDDNQSSTDQSQQVETGTGDTRSETWLTAEELGITKSEGTFVGGLSIPAFISYRGGFYGSAGVNRIDSLRFAPSESEDLLFNTHYTHTVYLVEDHPNWIAIHINGMEVYEKIFDVTFAIDGTIYAIAYSPEMNADYALGGIVLETEDYTVYEAVRLQGEPAQAKEYIVDILPLLQREMPNFFDGSDLEPDGDYADQWQLALPLNSLVGFDLDRGSAPIEHPHTTIVPGFDLDEPSEPAKS